MNKEATWRIIEEDSPERGWTDRISFSCPHCGADAGLPVYGIVLAQTSGGSLVFDHGGHSIPKIIECRFCRHRFERGA